MARTDAKEDGKYMEDSMTNEANKCLANAGFIDDIPGGYHPRNTIVKDTTTHLVTPTYYSHAEEGSQLRGSQYANATTKPQSVENEDRTNTPRGSAYDEVQMANRFSILQTDHDTESIQSKYGELNERGTDRLCVG